MAGDAACLSAWFLPAARAHSVRRPAAPCGSSTCACGRTQEVDEHQAHKTPPLLLHCPAGGSSQSLASLTLLPTERSGADDLYLQPRMLRTINQMGTKEVCVVGWGGGVEGLSGALPPSTLDLGQTETCARSQSLPPVYPFAYCTWQCCSHCQPPPPALTTRPCLPPTTPH